MPQSENLQGPKDKVNRDNKHRPYSEVLAKNRIVSVQNAAAAFDLHRQLSHGRERVMQKAEIEFSVAFDQAVGMVAECILTTLSSSSSGSMQMKALKSNVVRRIGTELKRFVLSKLRSDRSPLAQIPILNNAFDRLVQAGLITIDRNLVSLTAQGAEKTAQLVAEERKLTNYRIGARTVLRYLIDDVITATNKRRWVIDTTEDADWKTKLEETTNEIALLSRLKDGDLGLELEAIERHLVRRLTVEIKLRPARKHFYLGDIAKYVEEIVLNEHPSDLADLLATSSTYRQFYSRYLVILLSSMAEKEWIIIRRPSQTAKKVIQAGVTASELQSLPKGTTFQLGPETPVSELYPPSLGQAADVPVFLEGVRILSFEQFIQFTVIPEFDLERRNFDNFYLYFVSENPDNNPKLREQVYIDLMKIPFYRSLANSISLLIQQGENPHAPDASPDLLKNLFLIYVYMRANGASDEELFR